MILYIGISFDDYLGVWCHKDERYLMSPMFCYRVAEGKIGVNSIWHINNKERGNEYLINGNKIERKDGKRKGVYRFEDKLITWTDEDSSPFVWVRPGI